MASIPRSLACVKPCGLPPPRVFCCGAAVTEHPGGSARKDRIANPEGKRFGDTKRLLLCVWFDNGTYIYIYTYIYCTYWYICNQHILCKLLYDFYVCMMHANVLMFFLKYHGSQSNGKQFGGVTGSSRTSNMGMPWRQRQLLVWSLKQSWSARVEDESESKKAGWGVVTTKSKGQRFKAKVLKLNC